jgi:hypothetical protein
MKISGCEIKGVNGITSLRYMVQNERSERIRKASKFYHLI